MLCCVCLVVCLTFLASFILPSASLINMYTVCLCCFPAAPGLLFFVTNDIIQYVQLTERTFASFSTVLDDIMILLDAEADITGVCVRVQCTSACTFTFTCTSIWP